MALFGKKSISTGKSFTSVIKNGSPENTLLWKHENEDFNTGSTLIVNQSEEALFIRDGIVQQVFSEGRYILTTNNYPFITALRNLFTGGESSFHCEVYFIRTAHSREIDWGMSLQMRDPVLDVSARVMAQGAYKIAIENGELLLIKMIGSGKPVFCENDMVLYFRSEFSQKIKSILHKQIIASKRELLGLNDCLEEYAQAISPEIAEILIGYGIRLVNFTIGGLEIPMDDPIRMQLEEAFAQRKIREIHGITWGQQEAASILGDVARNPGAGGMAAAGAGLGMGVMTGNAIGQMAQQLFAESVPSMQPTREETSSRRSGRFATKARSISCPNCGADVADGGKFCSNCGMKVESVRMFCPNCGAEQMPGARFCSSCGHNLQ